MPVLGHAFAGLTMGEVVTPARNAPVRTTGLWVPVLVGLAYLPDIAAELLGLVGVRQARVATHSILFAVVASAVLAPILARLTGLSFRRAFAVALASIALHDALDNLAQASDRVPWWPFSARRVGSADAFLPTSLREEGLLFGSLWALWVGGRALARKARGSGSPERSGPGGTAGRLVWVGRGLVVAIMLFAGVTHHLRDVREQHLLSARARLEERDHAAALTELAQAERWPSTARPGRIEYLRAEAYAAEGDRPRAENAYLRSIEADPSYFWAVADLALFYASSDRALDERRRLVAPYVGLLRRDFARHRDLTRVLLKVEQRLGGAASDLNGGAGAGTT